MSARRHMDPEFEVFRIMREPWYWAKLISTSSTILLRVLGRQLLKGHNNDCCSENLPIARHQIMKSCGSKAVFPRDFLRGTVRQTNACSTKKLRLHLQLISPGIKIAYTTRTQIPLKNLQSGHGADPRLVQGQRRRYSIYTCQSLGWMPNHSKARVGHGT